MKTKSKRKSRPNTFRSPCDLYCQEKTKVILREENIPAIIASLQRTLTYDFGDVFCAHAGYLPNGREALQRKLDYLLELQGNIIDLYEKGMPPKQIQETLFPKKYPIVFFFGEGVGLPSHCPVGHSRISSETGKLKRTLPGNGHRPLGQAHIPFSSISNEKLLSSPATGQIKKKRKDGSRR